MSAAAIKKSETVLVIGVGNLFRKDDGAGLSIVRKVRERLGKKVRVEEECGEGGRLIQRFHEADFVVVVDATRSGRTPGTVFRFDAHEGPLPTDFFNYSTHHFSVAEAVETARALGQLPKKLVIFGVEGERFDQGEGLSESVRRSSHSVVEKIVSEVAAPPIDN